MNELATIMATPTGGAVVVLVDGEVDMSNAAELETTIRAHAIDASLVVLDLGAVSFFDSSGIRMLFSIRKECRARGVAIALVAPEDSAVSHVLDVARVDDAAPVFRTPEAAIAAMGAG